MLWDSEREYIVRFQELKNYARIKAPERYPALLEIEQNYVACSMGKISRKQYCKNLKLILARFKINSDFIDKFEKTHIPLVKERVSVKIKPSALPMRSTVARRRDALFNFFKRGL